MKRDRIKKQLPSARMGSQRFCFKAPLHIRVTNQTEKQVNPQNLLVSLLTISDSTHEQIADSASVSCQLGQHLIAGCEIKMLHHQPWSSSTTSLCLLKAATSSPDNLRRSIRSHSTALTCLKVFYMGRSGHQSPNSIPFLAGWSGGSTRGFVPRQELLTSQPHLQAKSTKSQKRKMIF